MTDLDINKHAGELSTNEVNKTGAVLNDSCQFKTTAHMLNRNSTRQHSSLRCHGQRVVQQRGSLDG